MAVAFDTFCCRIEIMAEQKVKFAEIETEQQQFIRSRFNGGTLQKIP